MSGRRVSITFSDYLGGGMLDGVPLWREGVADDAPPHRHETGHEHAKAKRGDGGVSGDSASRRATRARTAS